MLVWHRVLNGGLIRRLHHLLLLRLLHVDLLSWLLRIHHLAVLAGLHVNLLAGLLLGDLLVHHLLLPWLLVVNSRGSAGLVSMMQSCTELPLSSLLSDAADDANDGSDANDRAYN